MQTLSELISAWRPQVDQLSKSPALDAAYRRIPIPLSLLKYEADTQQAADSLLHRYSATLLFPQNNLGDEMLVLLMNRISEGCWYGDHLAKSGLGAEKKPAEDWIRFLTIDSWHEVVVYKWRLKFSAFYSK